MSMTIIGPANVKLTKERLPLVYTKAEWNGSWQYRSEMRLQEMLLRTCGEDLGRCVISRRYGSLKDPNDSSMSVRGTINLDGYWIQIRLASGTGSKSLWTGQIEAVTHDIYGSDPARSGVQTWTAYSPLQILRKKPISRSYWEEDKDLGWVPNMNLRGEHGTLYGNRSAGRGPDGVHLYGGESIWTHEDAVKYILKKFADSDNGPKWKLAGQSELLKGIRNVVPFRATQTVAEALAYLISPRMGIDYKIIESGNDFEIHVFALISEEVSFGGVSLPKNPNVVRIRSSEIQNMPTVQVVRSDELRYDKIRVLGNRMVLCSSLWGEKTDGPVDARFEKKWIDELETEYKAGTGTPADSAEDHDRARAVDKFESVYRVFAADDEFKSAAPTLDTEGNVVGGEQDYQIKVRETSHFTPLREGFDYTVDPPVDNNPPGFQSGFLPPMVYLKDVWARNRQLTGEPYIRANEVSIGTSVLWDDWGMSIGASPAHLLALDHFENAADTVTWPENKGYDYEQMIMTLARRADQRLVLVYGDEDGEMVKDIVVSSAELWLLMPDTVVHIDGSGEIKKSPGEIVTLRNDSEYLKFIMAGAIARYHKSRARASITLKGFQSWGAQLGSILTVVDEAGDTEKIEAPITSLHWYHGENKAPMTIIGAGFAL